MLTRTPLRSHGRKSVGKCSPTHLRPWLPRAFPHHDVSITSTVTTARFTRATPLSGLSLLVDDRLDDLIEVLGRLKPDNAPDLVEFRDPTPQVVELLTICLLVRHMLDVALRPGQLDHALRERVHRDLLVRADVKHLTDGRRRLDE